MVFEAADREERHKATKRSPGRDDGGRFARLDVAPPCVLANPSRHGL